MVYLGADHRGFYLKEKIKEFLKDKKVPFEDLGNLQYEKDDDYPDWGKKVAEAVSKNPQKNVGILICGSGLGMTIVANKFKGVRAGTVFSSYLTKRGKEEDDLNVFVLASDLTDESTAFRIIEEILKSKPKIEEKYARRVKKIEEIEKNNFK
ncbi:MAG: RpiB/LacA/LacB family sugar-phosphate isomerase [Candidatus Paceibacterota bacterium]